MYEVLGQAMAILLGSVPKPFLSALRERPAFGGKLWYFLPFTASHPKSGKCVMNRSVERRLRDAVRFLDDGTKEKPLRKRKPNPSTMEKRLMDAKKALRRKRVYRFWVGSH
jgi:hypothetical protein